MCSVRVIVFCLVVIWRIMFGVWCYSVISMVVVWIIDWKYGVWKIFVRVWILFCRNLVIGRFLVVMWISLVGFGLMVNWWNRMNVGCGLMYCWSLRCWVCLGWKIRFGWLVCICVVLSVCWWMLVLIGN